MPSKTQKRLPAHSHPHSAHALARWAQKMQKNRNFLRFFAQNHLTNQFWMIYYVSFCASWVQETTKQADKKNQKKLKIAFDKTNFYDILNHMLF